jgi:hypothetical protein
MNTSTPSLAALNATPLSRPVRADRHDGALIHEFGARLPACVRQCQTAFARHNKRAEWSRELRKPALGTGAQTIEQGLRRARAPHEPQAHRATRHRAPWLPWKHGEDPLPGSPPVIPSVCPRPGWAHPQGNRFRCLKLPRRPKVAISDCESHCHTGDPQSGGRSSVG